MSPSSPPDPLPAGVPKEPWLWWRGLLAFGALGGLVYLVASRCHPRGEPAQVVLFAALLGLILLETAQAGWFRGRDPVEGRCLRALRAWGAKLDWLACALVAVLGLALLLGSLALGRDEREGQVFEWLGLALFALGTAGLLLSIFCSDDPRPEPWPRRTNEP